MTLIGKKDTIIEGYYKSVSYTELLYTSNNVTTVNQVHYLKVSGVPASNTDYSFKFEYGPLINPLFEYFTHNPILTLYFPNFWLSQHNGNNKSYTRTISSTPLPGTNYVQEYVITGGSQAERVTYKFIKTVK